MIVILVPGAPIPKGRPRLTTFGGHARAFTPTKTRRYEDLIRLEAGRVMEGLDQLQGALSVKITAFMQTPQAIAKHKAKGPLAEAGKLRPLTKPDVDNFAKVIDALNGIVWRDDSQVVELTVSKFYSTRPRLELAATAIADTHPKDGDALAAPLVSGGGARSAIAHDESGKVIVIVGDEA